MFKIIRTTQPSRRLKLLVTVLVLTMLWLIESSGALQPSFAEGKEEDLKHIQSIGLFRVAILGFENKTGDPTADYWSITASELLSEQLSEVKEISVSPSVEFALRRYGLKYGDSINVEEAKSSGRLIDAQWVVWGSYLRRGEEWHAKVRILEVTTGRISGDLKAASSNWFEIRDRLTEQILNELGLTLAARSTILFRRWTASDVALGLYGRAKSMAAEQKPWTEREQLLREALRNDPQFAEAQLSLVVELANQAKLAEAEQTVRKASTLTVHLNDVHRLLGVVLIHQGKFDEAERELQIAIQLDSVDPKAYEWLGQLYSQRGLTTQAIQSFTKALSLNRFSELAHAHLAYAYIKKGNKEKARLELNEARVLTSGRNLSVEQVLWQAYAELHDAQSAAYHCERFVLLAKEQGVNPEWLRSYENILLDLRARLTPVYFEIASPTNYGARSLDADLRQKLNQEELSKVINPLESNKEMDDWAREITARATNDLQKAQMIFDTLNRSSRSNLIYRPRTAAQAFADWRKDHAIFHCQEYSFLFVALARAAGINAYPVYVKEAYDSQKALHICAAVFLSDKMLLVDVTYFWFGVPHKKFVVLNDLQATALHMCFLRNLELCRIAAKLATNLAPVQAELVNGLIANGCWKEAAAAIPGIAQFDGDGWLSYVPSAELAWYEGNTQLAIELVNKALAENPQNGGAHLLLGRIFASQGNLVQAKASFKSGLQCLLDESQAALAHQAVSQIGEAIHEHTVRQWSTNKAKIELDPPTNPITMP